VSAADGRLTAADGGMPAGDGGVSAADGRLTAADGGMPTGDDGVTAGNDGVPAADGRLNDSRRSEFLARCLAGVHRAIEEVIPVSAYSIWSLLDNLEWDLGLSKRFGLVYVDYNTLARIPKKSFGWYRSVVQANAVEERPLEERLEE
jgi:hypothetical protein